MAQNLSPSSWREVFLATQSTHGTIPSGSSITVHPVLNTEPNVVDSGWIRTGVDETNEYINQALVVNSDVNLDVFVVNAQDDVGTGIQNEGFPFLNVIGGIPADIGARFFSRYFRVIVVNTSGSTANTYEVRSVGGTGNTSPLTVSLNQPLFDLLPAPVTRTVTAGRRPGGTYLNTPADGNLVEESTLLGAAGSVVLGPFETSGYRAVEVYVATDQVSGTDGVVIEYTPNPSDPSPTYYPGPKFTYSSTEVTNGFMIKRFAPALEGFRMTYTNGGVAQGSFYASLAVKTEPNEGTNVSLENQISDTVLSLLTRGLILAQADSGAYSNVKQSDAGGLRVSVKEHESETPIKPLNNLSGNATSVGSTAVQIATSPPAGTKSIEIQADPDNTKVVYLGFNSGVTSGNAPVGLQAGDARVYEVETTPQFWAISTGSQSVRWTYIADV